MTIRFISDLHIDHKNIINFEPKRRGECSTVEEHNEWLVEQWNSVVDKSDLVWVLGDVSMTREGIKLMKKMKGNKHLILGNHDTFPLKYYNEVFNKVHGFLKYKGFYLSHPPIRETRNLINIHGHTHSDVLFEEKHCCVCVEACEGKPVDFEKIKEYYDSRSFGNE